MSIKRQDVKGFTINKNKWSKFDRGANSKTNPNTTISNWNLKAIYTIKSLLSAGIKYVTTDLLCLQVLT